MSVANLMQTLVARLPKHPEADRMKGVIQECLAAAEKFEAKRRVQREPVLVGFVAHEPVTDVRCLSQKQASSWSSIV